MTWLAVKRFQGNVSSEAITVDPKDVDWIAGWVEPDGLDRW